ncbi:MAG: permease prefix domain 2-containing transporter [Bacteroidota bacterium]
MQKSPRLPFRLLKLFCNPAYFPDIEGDLLEIYERRYETEGAFQANWRLWLDVLLLFRPGMIRPLKPTLALISPGSLTHFIDMYHPATGKLAKLSWGIPLAAFGVLFIAWIGLIPFNFIVDPVFFTLHLGPVLALLFLIYGLVIKRKPVIWHSLLGIFMPVVILISYVILWNAQPESGPIGFYHHISSFEGQEATEKAEELTKITLPTHATNIHVAKPSTGMLNWSAWIRFDVPPEAFETWMGTGPKCFTTSDVEQIHSSVEKPVDFTQRKERQPTGATWWTPEQATHYSSAHCRACPNCEPDYYMFVDKSQEAKWIVYIYGVDI